MRSTAINNHLLQLTCGISQLHRNKNTCYGERRVSHAKIKRFSSTPQGEFLVRDACPIIFYCSELYHSSLCQKIVTVTSHRVFAFGALKKSSIIRKKEEHVCLFDQKLNKNEKGQIKALGILLFRDQL